MFNLPALLKCPIVGPYEDGARATAAAIGAGGRALLRPYYALCCHLAAETRYDGLPAHLRALLAQIAFGTPFHETRYTVPATENSSADMGIAQVNRKRFQAIRTERRVGEALLASPWATAALVTDEYARCFRRGSFVAFAGWWTGWHGSVLPDRPWAALLEGARVYGSAPAIGSTDLRRAQVRKVTAQLFPFTAALTTTGVGASQEPPSLAAELVTAKLRLGVGPEDLSALRRALAELEY